MHGCVQVDGLGDRGQSGHERQGLHRVVPVLGRTAIAAPLAHGEHEVAPRLARRVTVIERLSSKVGMYCGAVVETTQPLLPIGMNSPIFMGSSGRENRARYLRRRA